MVQGNKIGARRSFSVTSSEEKKRMTTLEGVVSVAMKVLKMARLMRLGVVFVGTVGILLYLIVGVLKMLILPLGVVLLSAIVCVGVV